jgi:hypothetical protein
MPRTLEMAIHAAVSNRGVGVVVIPGDVALQPALDVPLPRVLRRPPRRRADDFENFGRGGQLFQCLVTLAGEPRELCFLAGSGGTTTVRGRWRIAALSRYRLAVSRFNWFAACSGAPSHLPPPRLRTRHRSGSN